MKEKIKGIIRITQNGLCNLFYEPNEVVKNLDPQIISGFFYALSKFTNDYIGEDIKEIRTDNIKILFKNSDDNIIVYFVDRDFEDCSYLDKKLLNEKPFNLAKVIITS
ncbi:MAG: hypothetical protein ACTSPY_00635 [Candidatus Helarchaeota archaeon]